MTKETFGYLQKCVFTVRHMRHIDRQTDMAHVLYLGMGLGDFHPKEPSPVQVAIVMSWFACIVASESQS